jgi:hypothetical protein
MFHSRRLEYGVSAGWANRNVQINGPVCTGVMPEEPIDPSSVCTDT